MIDEKESRRLEESGIIVRRDGEVLCSLELDLSKEFERWSKISRLTGGDGKLRGNVILGLGVRKLKIAMEDLVSLSNDKND